MNNIIRNKDNGYSVISNHCLRNKNISEKSKGVFAIIMSLPENWDFSINGLVSICNGGETAIRSAIKELIKHNYCQRNVIKDPITKRIIDWQYVFSEKPLCGFPQVEEPQMEIPNLDNQVQLNKDKPSPNNNKKLTKKEKYLVDFDSVIIEVINKRPKLEEPMLKWIGFKYDVLKQPYKTIAWLTGLLKFSDQEIIDGINTAIEKEWNGIYPKKSTSNPYGQQQQQITYKTIKKTEEQLYYEKMREESLLAKNG